MSDPSHLLHCEQDTKADDHTLVTSGIYSIWRHPSYFGWFWWSVFTQVVLANPISIIGYTLASWYFFADRIPYVPMLSSLLHITLLNLHLEHTEYLTAKLDFSILLFPGLQPITSYEEEKLEDMYGKAYIDYCKRVPIRIPFIPSKY